MNTPAIIYDLLNDETGITNIVNGISPFVRNRTIDFPAIIYDIQSEDIINDSTSVLYHTANIDISILSRSQKEAETILEQVFARCSQFSGTINGTCVRIVVDNISREYEAAEDSSSQGIFITNVSIIANLS